MEDKDFFDGTLTCDYGRVQAHSIVLALCCPLFQHVLFENHNLSWMIKTSLMVLLYAMMVEFRHTALFWDCALCCPLFQHNLLKNQQLWGMIKTSLVVLLHLGISDYRHTTLYCGCTVHFPKILCQKSYLRGWWRPLIVSMLDLNLSTGNLFPT